MALRQKEIRYILSYDGYVRIYTADRMYRRETSLEKMLELLDERLFVRIDRGTVVNMAYVEKEEGDALFWRVRNSGSPGAGVRKSGGRTLISN